MYGAETHPGAKTHLCQPGFTDLDQLVAAQQKGGFQTCPALEALRAVAAQAPLADGAFRPIARAASHEARYLSRALSQVGIPVIQGETGQVLDLGAAIQLPSGANITRARGNW